MHKRIGLGVGLAAVVVALIVASPGSAHFQTGLYTHNADGCGLSSRVDPINFVFWDWAVGGRVENNIEFHANWFDTGGTKQWFSTHDNCYGMTFQRASGSVTLASRYHIRVKHIPDTDIDLGYTGVGDAHHETTSICGHSVDPNGSEGSGFDKGRAELKWDFAAGLYAHTDYWVTDWGNTRNFKQCNGNSAGSDGRVVFMHIHAWWH